MSGLLRSAAASVLLPVLLAACGPGTGTEDSTVDGLRLRLNRTRCRNRMDRLVFRLQGLLFDVEEPAAASLDSVASMLGDTLTLCPSSLLPYSLRLEGGDIVVTCPDGHGRRSTELL